MNDNYYEKVKIFFEEEVDQSEWDLLQAEIDTGLGTASEEQKELLKPALQKEPWRQERIDLVREDPGLFSAERQKKQLSEILEKVNLSTALAGKAQTQVSPSTFRESATALAHDAKEKIDEIIEFVVSLTMSDFHIPAPGQGDVEHADPVAWEKMVSRKGKTNEGEEKIQARRIDEKTVLISWEENSGIPTNGSISWAFKGETLHQESIDSDTFGNGEVLVNVSELPENFDEVIFSNRAVD